MWDVEYNAACPSVFASASQDGSAIVWDERTQQRAGSFAHPSPIFCLSWNPTSECQIAVGDEEGTIFVYDTRSPAVHPLRRAPLMIGCHAIPSRSEQRLLFDCATADT